MGTCLRGKQYPDHDSFLQKFGKGMLCCLHLIWIFQYEDLTVFGCQSNDSAEDSKEGGWVQWSLRKSIRSIARDLGAFEFLISQVVYEDIRYFSKKMRKDQFLSQAMKDSAVKLFRKSNWTYFGFLRWEKFLAELDGELTEQQLAYSVPQDVPIVMKANTHSTSGCLGWSLAMVTLYLFSSFHINSHSTRRLIPSD